jgi:hypothetical protein
MSIRALSVPLRPRPIYALAADLQGFKVRALVYRDLCGRYGYSVTLDGHDVPGSPAGDLKSLPEAAGKAKRLFTVWTVSLLRRLYPSHLTLEVRP